MWTLDRADRRGADTLGAMLSRHAATGRRVLGVDGTDTGDPKQRMNIIIRGEMAREYSESLGDNVACTKRYRREDGRWLGGKPPWGLRVGPDGRLEHDPKAYPDARRAAEALLGGETLYRVVADLNEQQVTLPNGKSWGSTTVRKARGRDLDVESAPLKWRLPTLAAIVRSPGWAGLQSIRRRETREDGGKGVWPMTAEVYRSTETDEPVSIGQGVVTPDERTLILASISERNASIRESLKGKKPRRHVLGNLLVHVACGAPATQVGGAPKYYYRCGNAAQGPGRCEGFSCPVEDMNDHVIGRVLVFLSTLDPNSDTAHAVALAWMGAADHAQAERRAREAAVEVARAGVSRIRRLAVVGVITEEEAAADMPQAREELAAAERALAERQEADGVADWRGMFKDLERIARAWDNLDHGAQRRVIEASVKKVEVNRAPYRCSIRGVPAGRHHVFGRLDVATCWEDRVVPRA